MTSPDHGPAHADPGTTAVLPSGSVASTSPAPSGRRPWRRVVAGVAAVAAVAGGTTAYALSADDDDRSRPAAAGAVRAVAAATPLATVALSGAGADGLFPWQSPLTVSATGGTLVEVTAQDPAGVALAGSLGPDGAWHSDGELVPSTTYTVLARVRDTSGDLRNLPLSATTTAPEKTLKVTLTPGDDAVVGVGQAVALRLGTPVKDKAARAEIEKRLTVTTVPAVEGAWRWVSSSELRYRAETLWATGTKITVTAPLAGVQAVPGVWGGETRTSTFTVGDALTSVVDNQAHTMTVSRNGQVVRVMKASMGKPQFPTRNGTFVVLEKFADRVMDSATVDLPPGTPAYRTAVKDAVRITNSGTFTHGAPWSVRSQGVANVSHGCINLSPEDADWFYDQAKRGDVVQVVGSTEGPNLSDAGSQDWNMTFAQWKQGSALA